METKNKKNASRWNRIYSFFYKMLVTPPLRIASIIFSHGLTHFFALLATGFITGWLFFENSTIDIKPHHIGIDLQWTDDPLSILTDGSVMSGDSIRDLKIHVELNSNDALIKTNGRYRHRLVFEFEGGEEKEQLEKAPVFLRIRPRSKEDSVMIKLFSDPILSDVYVDIVPDNFIFDLSLVEPSVTDSLSDTIEYKGVSLPLYPITEPDTTRYICQHENEDSVFTIKLIPAKYNINGKLKSPKQTVYVYSNNIGVEENNPYYYYFIAIPSTKLSGSLKFEFKASDLTSPDDFNFTYAQNSHLQYNYVFPQPDIINNGYIEYHTKEKIEAIKKNQGVIIQAVDVKSLNHLNNLSFLYSVLVGTGLAFLIDVFIQLIKELRRVNNRRKEL